MKTELVKYSIEVGEALMEELPVVALESTIITHGMPYPTNVETALSVEAAVREEGGVPATIAIIDGRIRVGLSSDEIAWLGRLDRKLVTKVSRADLPFALSQKQIGATTVAGTMICASLAGISVFATGGIGGVHRGGEVSMDVSTDLYELARTNITVVCAGAKSILDIGKTLERLETFGVPVVGFQTREFPAFYYRDSGFALNMSVEHPKEIADLMAFRGKLGLSHGVLVACPVPLDEALDRNEVESYIKAALSEAETQNITGKEVTPFLLGKISILSEGKSLACNVALIKNNARIASQIAKCL